MTTIVGRAQRQEKRGPPTEKAEKTQGGLLPPFHARARPTFNGFFFREIQVCELKENLGFSGSYVLADLRFW